jgi:hypothetical protein
MGLDMDQVLALANQLPARVASFTYNGPNKLALTFFPDLGMSAPGELEQVSNRVPGSKEQDLSDADLALNPPDIYPDPEPVSGNTVYGQSDADPDDVQDLPETGTET